VSADEVHFLSNDRVLDVLVEWSAVWNDSISQVVELNKVRNCLRKWVLTVLITTDLIAGEIPAKLLVTIAPILPDMFSDFLVFFGCFVNLAARLSIHRLEFLARAGFMVRRFNQ
jgi:hypothetical protein